MQMGHGLASVAPVVNHNTESRLGNPLRPCNLGSGEQEVAKSRLITWIRSRQSRNRLLWHDENVDRRLRRNIAKSETEIVFVDDIRRDLAGADFLEKRHESCR